ncbi:MAG: metallophosphoesterase family protein [Balneola sp.]
MPKIAVISDIHGNLPALKVVLEKLDHHQPDEWICLGDIVGYGPNPRECLEIIRERGINCVMGNHDAGVSGMLSIKHFREPNRKLIKLTKTLLDEDQINWLKNLPYVFKKNPSWIAAHASPFNPEKWKYIDSAYLAREILTNIEQEICFIGHTHIPSFVSEKIGILNFKKGFKYLINPGSVGQSRDNDFRASCSIVDTDEWILENFRIEYNTEIVISGLTKLGFSRQESHHLMRF